MKVLVQESFRYANGAVAASQPIHVYHRGSTTPAQIFSPGNQGSAIANPARTDALGNLSFYVEEGLYDFSVLGAVVPFDAEAGGGESSRYVHVQATPSAAWTIYHNLNTAQAPSVVLDSDPTSVSWTDVEIIDLNTMVLTFDSAVTGKAYL